MPLATLEPLLVDADRFARSVDASSTSWGLGFRAAFEDAQLPDPYGFLVADADRRFDAHMRRMTGVSDRLAPEEATERFGIEGALKFDKPLTEAEAAWSHRVTRERLFRQDVLSNSEIGPLGAFGAGILGSILDPAALPLLLAPEALGVAKGAAWLARGGRAAETVINAGRLATGARWATEGLVEGALGGGLYESANYSLRRASGEDYDGGDALRNIVLGAVFGGAVKGVLGTIVGGKAAAGFDTLADEAEIEGLPSFELPPAVEALPEDLRAAAATLAIDRMADDAPVDMAPVLDRQRAVSLRTLDEVDGNGGALRGRFLEPDTAVSTRGTEIPVRYALVEIDDLVTSHDDDLVRNPDYPGELQPRDRGERAGSIAANRGLQGRLHPRLLLESASAETGSPIVSRDGVVESGNGRLIAMRRDAAEGGQFWDRYQEALSAAGYDVEGLSRPVLVRVRESVLTGEQRAALARELNPSMTEQMGPREQAMADAAAMPAEVLEKLSAGPVDGAGNAAFAKAFLEKLAPDQLNSLVDSAGRLSKDGADRLRAAVMAVAYGDGGLLEVVFEQADGPLKAIGQGLVDAAPAWARMRADMARGLTPPELDLTGNIKAAVDLIRHARDKRMALPRLLAEREGQLEAFGDLGLSRETATLLNLFYDNPQMTKPRDPELVAAFLDGYAKQAQAKTPGPDLFGETHEGAARAILENLAESFRRQDGAFGDILERLRAEQADAPGPNARADAPGDAGAVLFGAGREDGVAGGRGPGAGPEGAGEAVEKRWTPNPNPKRWTTPADVVDVEEARNILAPAIEASTDNKGPRVRVVLGGLSPWLSGLIEGRVKYVERFKHVVDSEHIRKILTKHGAKGKGAANGEIPMTAEDLTLLPQIFADPDRVIIGSRADEGPETVIYLKTMPEQGFAVVEAIRNGRGMLDLKSMWKYPAATNAEAMMASLRLHVLEALPDDGGNSVTIHDFPARGKAGPEAAEAAAGEQGAEAAPPANIGQAFIAADPELKALFEDTQAMLAREGLDGEAVPPARDPDTIAGMMRTAALCLLDGADDLT